MRLIKQAATDAGLDGEKFSGHSLRRAAGSPPGPTTVPDFAQLMRQSRHRSTQSVIGYLEPAELWRNNVTGGCFSNKS